MDEEVQEVEGPKVPRIGSLLSPIGNGEVRPGDVEEYLDQVAEHYWHARNLGNSETSIQKNIYLVLDTIMRQQAAILEILDQRERTRVLVARVSPEMSMMQAKELQVMLEKMLNGDSEEE